MSACNTLTLQKLTTACEFTFNYVIRNTNNKSIVIYKACNTITFNLSIYFLIRRYNFQSLYLLPYKKSNKLNYVVVRLETHQKSCEYILLSSYFLLEMESPIWAFVYIFIRLFCLI